MDHSNGDGQAIAAPTMPPLTHDAQIARMDHQLADQGTPDPVPVVPTHMHTPHTFQPLQPVAARFESMSAFDAPSAVTSPVLSNQLSAPVDDRPVPVVKVLSVRGVEYAMMTFMLWFGAASLIWILDTIILGDASFQVLAFPLSTLLISLPVFAVLYLRLRKAELADPTLRLEPSKRRFSQITQIIAFLSCVFNLIALVYTFISIAGGGEAGSIGKIIGATLVTLFVAGGILVYYWFDEHKLIRR